MAQKKSKELNDLFLDTLRDIYYAEQKILKALPKMKNAAQEPELKAAFEKHLGETDKQVRRLEDVFASIGEKAKGKKCPGIDGILKESDEVAKGYKGSAALDAALLCAAQAVEHYEIARYGTLKTWARDLGMSEVERLLDQTLSEEKETDKWLSQIAETSVNEHAQAA
jgi:ferritin-like metal-binding protein YciE